MAKILWLDTGIEAMGLEAERFHDLNRGHILTATNDPKQALDALREKGPFDFVVANIGPDPRHSPGLRLLAAAEQQSPAAGRCVLTLRGLDAPGIVRSQFPQNMPLIMDKPLWNPLGAAIAMMQLPRVPERPREVFGTPRRGMNLGG